jgi:hypothetical protein
MSIFEGSAEQPGATEAGGLAPDPRLAPLRRGIGWLHQDGQRIGVVGTDVQVVWRTEGMLRKRQVDPREVVLVQMVLDTVDADPEEYNPIDLAPVDDEFEADDPTVDLLLTGRLEHAGWELDVVWLSGVEAARAHAEWDYLFDIYPEPEQAP